MKDLIDSILIGGCASYLPILDLEQCRRTACRSTSTDRSSVHSQTVACMEKLLIKGKKNETNKKESKWSYRIPMSTQKTLRLEWQQEELTVFGEVANLLGAYEDLGTPEELRELIQCIKA